MESKQHTPSVIASLMGFYVMPHQQPPNKQHRVLSESYLRKTASIGVREKRPTYESRSFRMSIDEHQEFKDIFKVPATSKMDEHQDLPVQLSREKSNLSKSKTLFTSDRFKDVSQHSKTEFGGTVDELDSRSDVLQRTTGKTAVQGNGTKLHQNHENSFLKHLHKELGVDYTQKSRDGACLSSTRIVVLKPSSGKAQNASKSFFPPGSYEGSLSCKKNHKEFRTLENGDLFVRTDERKKVDNDMEFSRHSFRVSREIAKEIARKMKHYIRSSSTDISKADLTSNGTSKDQPELTMPPSHISLDWKNGQQNLLYHSNALSVNRETKKRFLERWKTTKRYQEVGLSSRSVTLGEMLAMPHQEIKPRNLDVKLGKHGLRNQCALSDEDVKLGSHLGINIHDGWKDGCAHVFPKSRCVPPTASGSPNAWTRGEALNCDWYVRPEETVYKGQHESRKQNFDQKDVLKPRNSTSNCRRPLSFPCMDLDNYHTSQEGYSITNEMKSKLVVENPPEQRSMALGLSITSQNLSEWNSVVPKSSVSSVASVSMVSDVMTDEEMEDVGTCFVSPKKQQSKSFDCNFAVKDRASPSCVLDPSIPQETLSGSIEEGKVMSLCPRMDIDSPGCSDESYQPSPVSVLDSLLKEEISSRSECFESISPDLHGLQMQLLKSEPSESYSEGPEMIMTSNEDTGEGSVNLSQEHEFIKSSRPEGNRDFSYLVDVLDEAGSHDGNWDLDFEIWHSPECPLSPLVFKVLEKKYEEQMSWDRTERRLLFDRINSGLLEIFLPCISPGECAKPVRKRFGSRLSRELVEEDLWLLLVDQEKEASKKSSEKVLGKDMRWLELGDEIELIGREIERLLIEELAEEVVALENRYF
ncbi:uncharacterized protein LOC131166929 [Malania oleifera]|uniref:uncharacterized protein LOC131166929 n=1 Tax=Malania oleifera TaxID=397392 RepID=UPI0025AEC636|nr:uncharacterized protein LOC131166929 [Malania oleifera]